MTNFGDIAYANALTNPDIKISEQGEQASIISEARTLPLKSDVRSMPPGNKYHARRTWSEMTQCWFASKGECAYGEMLWLRQKAGDICNLKFHEKYVLCDKPERCTIEVDFVFDVIRSIWKEQGETKMLTSTQYQDFKGAKEARDYRVKRLWLLQKFGIRIELVK